MWVVQGKGTRGRTWYLAAAWRQPILCLLYRVCGRYVGDTLGPVVALPRELEGGG